MILLTLYLGCLGPPVSDILLFEILFVLYDTRGRVLTMYVNIDMMASDIQHLVEDFANFTCCYFLLSADPEKDCVLLLLLPAPPLVPAQTFSFAGRQ